MISRERAESIVVRNLERRRFWDFLMPSRCRTATPEAVEVMYLPYWIAIVENSIPLTGGRFGMVVAMDGVRGELGIAIGCPDFSKKPPSGVRLVSGTISRGEAQKRIYDYARTQYSRKKKVLPVTTICRLEEVYMPYYVVQARVVSTRENFRVTRFIDAETGVPVYRYDGEREKLKSYLAPVSATP